MKTIIKLHLGCGKRNFGDDWIHIDGANFPHIKFKNIIKLPFKDNSVNIIYASHIIEYFDREEIKIILKEWHRVLNIEGILRVAVPDFQSIAKLYVENKFPLNYFLGPLYGKMNMNDKVIYHKTVYDFYELHQVLDSVGFKNIHKYDWRNTEHSNVDDHSQAYLPHMDKEKGVLISLNVECNKI